MDVLSALLEVGGFAVCAYIAWYGVRTLLFARAMRRGSIVLTREQIPLTPVPETLLPIEAELLSLGFVPSRHHKYTFRLSPNPVLIWTYLHPDLPIEAGLTSAQTRPPFNIALETWFTNGALFVTFYPAGNTMNGPDFTGGFASHSLQNAFTYHVASLQNSPHGEPRQFPDDDDAYSAAVIEMQTRHNPTIYAPGIRQAVGTAFVWFGIALLLMTFLLAMRAGIISSAIENGPGLIILPLLLLSLILIVGGSIYAKPKQKPVAVDAAAAPPVDPTMHPLKRPERIV